MFTRHLSQREKVLIKTWKGQSRSCFQYISFIKQWNQNYGVCIKIAFFQVTQLNDQCHPSRLKLKDWTRIKWLGKTVICPKDLERKEEGEETAFLSQVNL